MTLFSPENRYRLGDLFFVVFSRFSVLGPLFQKRADLNVPPTFGSDSFWCRVGSSFGSVFFMFFLNFFRERRSRALDIRTRIRILSSKSIPPWAFCLTNGVEQDQEIFDDVRILFPCPKGVNR